MRAQTRGLLLLLPVVLLWAATPLLVSELAAELPVLQINFLATACSLAVLAAVALVSGRWRSLRRDSGAAIWRLLLLGLVGIFPYTMLYYLALTLAPQAAGSVNIANYLWPIWIVILSLPLLREPFSPVKLAALLVSFAGVVLLTTVPGLGRQTDLGRPAPVAAYAAAGAAAFFWGLFSVLSKRHRHEALSAMLLHNAGAIAGFAAAALIGAALGRVPLVRPSPRAWLLLVLLGGAVNGLGYLLWILALRQADTALVSSLVYLVPFVALAYLRIFRSEPVGLVQLAALMLVLVGPLLLQLQALRSSGALPAGNR